MGKEGKKPLTAEEAEQKLASAKTKLQEAKDKFIGFCKKNGLKKEDDASNHEDEKIAKAWKKLKAEMVEAADRVEKYQALYKQSKKKNLPVKAAKYSYPKDVTSGEDKKKYRQLVRSKAKKLSITVDDYLADPEKYDKAYKALPVAEKGGNIKAAQEALRKKQAEAKASKEGKSEKKAKKEEEAPAKESKKPKKKKATTEASED